MSNLSITPMRAYYDIRLNQEDIILLSIVCSHTDIDGYCYPGLARLSAIFSPIIGREALFSISAISKKMLRLEQYGYLANEFQRKTRSGSFKSNQYKVIYDAVLPIEFSRLENQPSLENTRVENQPSLENSLEEITTNAPIERPKLNELSETKVSESSPEEQERANSELRRVASGFNLPVIKEATASVKLDKGERSTQFILPKSITGAGEHKSDKSFHAPSTPLSKYLAEQSKYGNRHWDGFQSAGERDDWLKMEETFDEKDITSAIDWACSQMRFGKKVLVSRVITAVNNQKRAISKDSEQQLDPSKVL